jgi:hypothetical protein
VSGVGSAPRSRRTLERESTGWKWCGPQDCGFPDRPCRWGRCEEQSRIEVVFDQELGRSFEVEMSCLARDHRHAHYVEDMHQTARKSAPTRGQSPQPKKKPKPRGAYVPRVDVDE